MKKYISLLMGICLSVSLSAANQVPQTAFKALPFNPSANTSFHHLAEGGSIHHSLLTPAVQKAIAHAPAATQGETKNVTFKWYSKSYNDYQKAWQIVLEADACRFDITFKAGTTEIEYGKVYKMDDLNKTYTYVSAGGNFSSLSYMELVITLDEDSKEHIQLVATDTKKNPTTYIGAYNPKPLPPCQDTIDVVLETTDFQDERYYSSHGYWYFIGRKDSMEYQLYVNSFNIVGDIDPKDVLINTYGYDLRTGIYCYHSNGKIEAIEVGKVLNGKVVQGPTEGEYIAYGDMYAYDGHCYRVTFKHLLPEPKETIELNFHNMVISDIPSYGIILYSGHNDRYNFQIILYEEAEPGHTYKDISELGVIDLFDKEKGTIEQFNNTGAKVTGTTESPKFETQILSRDSILYKVTLDYQKPSPKITIPLNIHGQFRDNTYEEEQPNLQAVAYSQDSTYLIQLVLNTEYEADHEDSHKFYWEDIDMQNTYIVKNPNSESPEVFILVELLDETVNVPYIDYTYDAIKEQGEFIFSIVGQNNEHVDEVVRFDVDMVCDWDYSLLYDADEDYEGSFTLDELDIDISSAEEGVVMVQGENAEGKLVAMLFFFQPGTADKDIYIPEGKYDISYTIEPGIVLASTGITGDGVNLSFVSTLTNGGLSSPIWFFCYGQVEVKKINGKIRINIEAKNSHDRSISIKMGEGVERDTEHLYGKQWKHEAGQSNNQIVNLATTDSIFLFDLDVKGAELIDNKEYTAADINTATVHNTEKGASNAFTVEKFIYHIATNKLETYELLGSDEKGTHYHLTGSVVNPNKWVTLPEMTEVIVYDYTRTDQQFQIKAYNADHSYYLTIAGGGSRTIEGHYEGNWINPNYTLVATDPDNMPTVYDYVDGSFDIRIDLTDTTLYASGSLITRNEDKEDEIVQYDFAMSTKISLDHCLNGDADESKSYTHTFNGSLSIQDISEEGLSAVLVETHDIVDGGDEFVYMVMYVEEIDPKTIIPVGTYTIDDTYMPYTIQRSEGIIESASSASISPSFIARRNDKDKQEINVLWMLYDGTMTVEYNDGLEMHLVGTNSCNAPIDVTIIPSKTDLPNLQSTIHNPQSTIHKELRDGRIIIERKGTKYNIFGSQLTN